MDVPFPRTTGEACNEGPVYRRSDENDWDALQRRVRPQRLYFGPRRTDDATSREATNPVVRPIILAPRLPGPGDLEALTTPNPTPNPTPTTPDYASILAHVLTQLEKILQTHECPIKSDISRNLVVASDGHLYDRAEITRWVQQEGSQATSPVSREKISTVFYPAYAAAQTVDLVQALIAYVNTTAKLAPKVPSESQTSESQTSEPHAIQKPDPRETRCAFLERLPRTSDDVIVVYNSSCKRYFTVGLNPNRSTRDLYDLYGFRLQIPEGSFKLICEGAVLGPDEPLSNYKINSRSIIMHVDM